MGGLGWGPQRVYVEKVYVLFCLLFLETWQGDEHKQKETPHEEFRRSRCAEMETLVLYAGAVFPRGPQMWGQIPHLRPSECSPREDSTYSSSERERERERKKKKQKSLCSICDCDTRGRTKKKKAPSA